MSRIPYGVSNKISFPLRWPSRLYRAMFDILIECNGLGIVFGHAHMDGLLHENRGKNLRITPESAYFVFRHVTFRTLQFNKIFEFIRINDVTNGLPSIAVAGCGLSEITIKRAFRISSESNCFVKLRMKPSQAVTPLYGLNLPLFMKLVDAWWEAALIERDRGEELENCQLEKSLLSKRARQLLDICVEYLEPYEPAFKFLSTYQKPIEDIDDFVSDFVGHLPDRHSRPCSRSLIEQLRSCRKRWY